MQRGIAAGLIAGGATAGVLLGFGHARRTAFRPINAIAHVFFGSRALLYDGFDVRVTIAGLVVHLVSLAVWGVIFAALASRLRGWALAGAALVFTALAYIVDYVLVPERLRPGFEVALSRPEISIVYLVMAIALAFGLKLSAQTVDIS